MSRYQIAEHYVRFFAQDVVSAANNSKVLYREIFTRVTSRVDDQPSLPAGFFEKLQPSKHAELACRQLDEISHLPKESYGINLNLAHLNGSQEAFADCIEAKANAGVIDPSHIYLEVLETGIKYGDEVPLRRLLDRLKSMGCKLAIDDFGARNANFDFLSEWGDWFDIVKIDGPLFGRSLNKPTSYKLLQAMVDFMHDQGMEVVVEHIETEQHLECAIDLGASFVQGYLIETPNLLLRCAPTSEEVRRMFENEVAVS